MQNELETLQDFTTSGLAGIVWFTKDNLQKKPPFFSAFDYFFDGLLLKKINGPEAKNLSYQTFFTKHFNQDFILAHLDASNENWQNDLQKFVDYLKKVNLSNRKLGVINLTDHKVTEHLQKKYSAKLIVELKV